MMLSDIGVLRTNDFGYAWTMQRHSDAQQQHQINNQYARAHGLTIVQENYGNTSGGNYINRNTAQKDGLSAARPVAQTKVDIFKIGLPPVPKKGAPEPARLILISESQKNQPTTISATVTYQVIDQYGNPFTTVTSEGYTFEAHEEVETMPESIFNVPGGVPKAKTDQTDLKPDGTFPDGIELSSGASGIRIPNDTNIQSRQAIYVENPETGTRYYVRLNLINITRSGVVVRDVSKGIP